MSKSMRQLNYSLTLPPVKSLFFVDNFRQAIDQVYILTCSYGKNKGIQHKVQLSSDKEIKNDFQIEMTILNVNNKTILRPTKGTIYVCFFKTANTLIQIYYIELFLRN